MIKPSPQKELLNDLRYRASQIVALAEHNLAPISLDLLLQAPDNERWSIAQSLQHIILFQKRWAPAMDSVSNKPVPYDSLHGLLKNTYWGKKRIEEISLKADGSFRKLHTERIFNPVYHPCDKNPVDAFTSEMKQLIAWIEQCEALDLNRNKVIPPRQFLFRVNLGEALQILTYHAERHIRQALNVLKELQKKP